VRSCVALYGKTGGWRVKKVTAWFEKVLLPCFGRVKCAVGHALRLTSLRDEWRRMTYPTAHLTERGRARSIPTAKAGLAALTQELACIKAFRHVSSDVVNGRGR